MRGTAALADGTPIPIERLDSGEVRNTSTFRGAPTSVFRTPGTAAGWTMIYDVNRPLDRERTVLTPSARRDVIMAGAHAMGYGHALVPPPAEIQLADGEVPGPALGCEASAGESNAVSSADDKAVNLASADLALTGKAMATTVNMTGDKLVQACCPFASSPTSGAGFIESADGGTNREVETPWRKAIARRVKEIESGKARGIPAAQAMAKARRVLHAARRLSPARRK